MDCGMFAQVDLVSLKFLGDYLIMRCSYLDYIAKGMLIPICWLCSWTFPFKFIGIDMILYVILESD